MATCSFIREKKQTAGAMGGVLRYVAQEQKTVDTDGTRYLTGINCAADLAYQSFLATKNLYGKARGTWFYHYVQSFPPQERVTPAEAHQIAQELAERFFPDCEVLVATHIDRAHLHSHLVVNSVKPDTGEKLHFTPRTLERMRLVSDQICREHGLTTLKPYRPKKQVKRLRPGEYRSAMRGQSWKFQLIAVIEAVMERTGNREEFLNELRRRGYDARWEEGRKRITYITPTGMRCRDDKLHEEKFRKEKMEYEFRIRQRAAQHDLRQAETADTAYADGSASQRPLHYADDDGGAAGGSPAEDLGPAGDHPGGYGELATKENLKELATGQQLVDWLNQANSIHQGICRDLRQTVQEMKEEHKQDGRRRDEFMRKLSELEAQFRRNWDEASARFQGKILLTILASGIVSAVVSILMWRVLL